jgi:hypothetical protein
MVKGTGMAKSRTLAFLTLFAMGNQANAHGLVGPTPLGHFALSAHSFFVKPSAHSSLLLNTRLPGLSGSQSIFRNEIKDYTGQGVYQGIVAQFNSGNIGGQINSTIYEQLYTEPPGTIESGNVLLTFGTSNPLFTNPPPTISVFTPTSVSFTPSLGSARGGLLGVTSIRLSGTQRIIQNQLNGLILNGVKVGRTVAATGLTGGYFVGTAYGGTPPNFTAFGNVGTAFGNSRLNFNIPTNDTSANPFPNQTSYLNFLNKINIPVGSAQIYAAAYADANGGGVFFLDPGKFVFTVGSNPLNVPSATSSFTRTVLDQSSWLRLLSKF